MNLKACVRMSRPLALVRTPSVLRPRLLEPVGVLPARWSIPARTYAPIDPFAVRRPVPCACLVALAAMPDRDTVFTVASGPSRYKIVFKVQRCTEDEKEQEASPSVGGVVHIRVSVPLEGLPDVVSHVLESIEEWDALSENSSTKSSSSLSENDSADESEK